MRGNNFWRSNNTGVYKNFALGYGGLTIPSHLGDNPSRPIGPAVVVAVDATNTSRIFAGANYHLVIGILGDKGFWEVVPKGQDDAELLLDHIEATNTAGCRAARRLQPEPRPAARDRLERRAEPSAQRKRDLGESVPVDARSLESVRRRNTLGRCLTPCDHWSAASRSRAARITADAVGCSSCYPRVRAISLPIRGGARCCAGKRCMRAVA
jgi:hypothetical protein